MHLRWMICVLAVIIGVGGSAVAQEEDQRQRQLELPTGNAPSFQMQMQMLKQLQTLLGSSSNSDGSGLTESQRNMMKGLLENFGDSDNLPDLSQLPPDLVGKVLGDPKARQQAKDLLEEFQRSRRLPQPNSDGNSGLPLPPKADSTSSSPNASTDRGDRKPAPSRGSNDGTNPRTPRNPQFPNGSRQDLRNQQFSPDDSTAQLPQEPPVPRRRQGESRRSFNARMSEYFEDILEYQNSLRDGTDELGNTSTEPSGNLSSDANNNRRTSPSISGNSGPAGRSQSERSETAPPSILDMQKQFESMAPGLLPSLDNLPKPDESSSQTGKPGSSSSSSRGTSASSQSRQGNTNNSRRPGNAPSSASTDESQQQQRENRTQQKLKTQGIGEAFKEIMRQSKSNVEKRIEQSKQAASGGTLPRSGSDWGFEDALKRTIGGLAEDVVEMAKDGRISLKPKQGSNRRPARPRPSPRSAPKEQSWLNQASEFISKAADSPKEAASTASSSAATADSDFNVWLPLLTLLILAAIAFAVARRSGWIPSAATAGNQTPVRSTDIRTRADVVRAFHQVARTPETGVQEWWTHQQAAAHLRNSSNEAGVIDEFASVYEQARYLPDDVELSDYQMEAARNAVKRCRS